MKVGFLINPVAGLGGRVALKGTDGLALEAKMRGALPLAPGRAEEALSLLKQADILFVTCSGKMGEDSMKVAGIGGYSVVYHYNEPSLAENTREACQAFLTEGVSLVVFTGGDGTARDVFDVVGRKLPIIGIPAGVKMFSGVFAVSTGAAAELINPSEPARYRDSEIADVDEDAYRNGELRTKVYGIARVPYLTEMAQDSKRVFEDCDDEKAKEGIAQFLSEVMADGMLTILGPGTTTEAIAEKFGLKKTLLGFDAVENGSLIARDLDERGMISLIMSRKGTRIIVSPIGAQGFVLGRGTQVISPEVIRLAGTGNLIVVATPAKLNATPVLYFDTGDPELDECFGGSVTVISGYRTAQRKRLFNSARNSKKV